MVVRGECSNCLLIVALNTDLVSKIKLEKIKELLLPKSLFLNLQDCKQFSFCPKKFDNLLFVSFPVNQATK